jgi:glycogen synthase
VTITRLLAIQVKCDSTFDSGKPECARINVPEFRTRGFSIKILLHSRFHPSVGGIETVAAMLAQEWCRQGQEVTVVSDVKCSPQQGRELPFPINYQPPFREWLRLVRKAELLVHMNISLKALWPLLLVRRPFVAVHHGFYECDRTGRRDWREKLKLRVMHRATNISASQAIARRIGISSTVVPNPADVSMFQDAAQKDRPRELVFVGRLVSDKGVDLLLTAMRLMGEKGSRPRLTIIGGGSERAALERIVESQCLAGQVRFTGALDQAQVAEELGCHQIMVVPSLWEEPFGIVALEGAAAGCVVVGSDGGGLPEAIGPTGVTFRRGDAMDLAAKVTHLLRHPEERSRYRAAAPAHLAAHEPAAVAAKYLEVFRRVLGLPPCESEQCSRPQSAAKQRNE